MLKDPKKENVDIIDIDLSPIRKKRFRINGDDNKILEINVSDLNIFVRLENAYPKLDKLAQEAVESLPDSDTETSEEYMKKLSASLKTIDVNMRELVDYIFDAPVSEICAPDGSMYDPFNGRLRFEYILETIASLYENNFDAEVKKMTQAVSKHTAKYTKKRKK